MNCREMLQLVDVLASEKNVAKDTVFGVLEAALASAVKKAQFPGEDADVVVHVDRVTGEFKAARRWARRGRRGRSSGARPSGNVFRRRR